MKPKEARKYDRIAKIYDVLEAPLEVLALAAWRRVVWSSVSPGKILEIGVGTGKNFPYYPANSEITAIDISERMLAYAQKKRKAVSVDVKLLKMDVHNLEFDDQTFDTVVSTFVFCSVTDPIRGLQEARRVCKPSGRLVFLEHVRSEGPLGPLFDFFNPLVVTFYGANINRRTVENIKKAGLKVLKVQDLFYDVVKLIEAQP